MAGKFNKKALTTAVKLLASAVLLYFVFNKIQLQDVLQTLGTTDPYYLFLALLAFMASKLLAAFRLNAYLHQLNVLLTHMSNLKLYLLGMFYNLFLPGGIGGDAYKGYVLKKEYGIKTKRVVAIMVLDRLSGLLLLFIYACFLGIMLETSSQTGIRIAIISALFLSLAVFWLLNKRFFDYVFPVFWKSVGYSAGVQLLQLVSVFLIWKSLGLHMALVPYLFVFLVSSIVAVLPVTIGGIGSREVVFLYGSLWLGLDEGSAISISVVFFLITALVSLFGMIYHFRKPVLEVY
ncbi:lysylphosphatidylglycerol synthase transmembrane domain-containing protein [Lentiprolixibacter aurantiacus]|uniref:Lysylphosphatidylglycerol synthase transmembrane domain-containing protein n=1 Tax=Lentiprolixibacter aurantiacus TaxID=2993939 RepID=A0AAE3SPN8_9FLAO|nr:lysylphosphatidylglycerol synthase transmembrane domain-containing protein [Lentiprolixibacter aurantiacus]MCX2720451.1 lysylphosphatidylglycerol synthase transmembrane domain-containing protein [Lentiprolixibacter aurantiacus]